MKKSRTIFILDGEQRSALAATRSLGKAGLSIVVGASANSSLAGSSKYCLKHVQYESPYKEQVKFIKDINSYIEKENVGYLLPMTDISISTILMHLDGLNSVVKVLCSEMDKYQKASDKNYLMKMAMDLGVPVPETLFFESASELEKNSNTLGYPVILKPSTSIIRLGSEAKQVGVKVINSREEFNEIIKNNSTFLKPFMLQEKLVGEGVGIFALFDNGVPKAVFSHRRIREKPPWGGVSVLCESTEPDPEAKDYAFKLLKELNWNGVAMVEFKRDNRTNTPMLMEINARFWGSLQLSIDSGIDFPYLLYTQSKGEQHIANITNEYNYSRLRWFLGDLDNLYITLKNQKKISQVYQNLPGKSHAIKDFFKEFFNKSRFEILRTHDIKPFIFELSRYVSDIFKLKKSAK